MRERAGGSVCNGRQCVRIERGARGEKGHPLGGTHHEATHTQAG